MKRRVNKKVLILGSKYVGKSELGFRFNYKQVGEESGGDQNSGQGSQYSMCNIMSSETPQKQVDYQKLKTRRLTASLEECYSKLLILGKKCIQLNVQDCQSLDQFSLIYQQKYSTKVDGYVFVYSVMQKTSLEIIIKLRAQLFQLNNQRHLPSVLVANTQYTDQITGGS